MTNSVHEELKRLLKKAEEEVKAEARDKYDSRDMHTAKVLEPNAAGIEALGVPLIASYTGWSSFVDKLEASGLFVETRRWRRFNDHEDIYDLFVAQP